MQSVKITSITDASLEKFNGGIKLTAKINGSKMLIDAWVSKALQAECKSEANLIKRLKECKDINLGASAEVNETGNTVIKYWITKPSTGKIIASW